MLLLLVAVLSQTPEIDRLRRECERSLAACTQLEVLEAKHAAEQEKAWEERRKAEAAEHEATLERQRQEVDAANAKAAAVESALRKKCGKDFGRVRVGMKWSRVRECAGDEWSLRGEDESGAVYEASGGFVRVENGKVTRWVAR